MFLVLVRSSILTKRCFFDKKCPGDIIFNEYNPRKSMNKQFLSSIRPPSHKLNVNKQTNFLKLNECQQTFCKDFFLVFVSFHFRMLSSHVKNPLPPTALFGLIRMCDVIDLNCRSRVKINRVTSPRTQTTIHKKAGARSQLIDRPGGRGLGPFFK